MNLKTILLVVFAAVVLLIVSLSAYYIVVRGKRKRQDNEKLSELRQKIEPIFKETYLEGPLSSLDGHNMLADIGLDTARRSYTLEKRNVFLCLRDESGQFYEDSMLTYVLLHEVAHVISRSIGHTPEFYEIFDALLAKADELKILDRHFEPVEGYCNYPDLCSKFPIVCKIIQD